MNQRPLPPFRYLAISDSRCCPEPVPDRITRLFKLGVPAVQLRDKYLSARSRISWINSIERTSNDILLINQRLDIAALTDLDGIHLPGQAIPPLLCRRLLRANCYIGLSTHTTAEVFWAAKQEVDYVTYGPIFPTSSKPHLTAADCPGLTGLRQLTSKTALPVFALGGVTPEMVLDCLQAGAYGVAGIKALFQPEDPAENWEKIHQSLVSFS